MSPTSATTQARSTPPSSASLLTASTPRRNSLGMAPPDDASPMSSLTSSSGFRNRFHTCCDRLRIRSNPGSAMKTACIIPVRGGSKGVPRKNLAELVEGVSLLEWTIRQAQRAYASEEVFVSTEDEELMRVARASNAKVVARPMELAQDESTTASVVEHLLEGVDPGAHAFAAISILQVTSPLRTVEDILASREM